MPHFKHTVNNISNILRSTMTDILGNFPMFLKTLRTGKKACQKKTTEKIQRREKAIKKFFKERLVIFAYGQCKHEHPTAIYSVYTSTVLQFGDFISIYRTFWRFSKSKRFLFIFCSTAMIPKLIKN